MASAHAVQIAGAGSDLIEVRVANDRSQVGLLKVDADTGHVVVGASLELRHADGSPVYLDGDGTYLPPTDGASNGERTATWVSGPTPFVIRGLPVGETFLLHELAAPQGYIAASEPVEFTVAQLLGEQQVAMTNELTQVEVAKVDALTGTPLAGATLAVYEKGATTPAVHPVTGEPLEWVSDGNPKAIYGLKVGQAYEVREVRAPAGYVPLAQPVTFMVPSSRDGHSIVVANVPTSVKVTKVDAVTKTALPGARLEIVDAETGSTVVDPVTGASASWLSGEDPFQFHRLEIGKRYLVREVFAPDGYAVADPVEFTLDTTGAGEVTVENARIPVSFGDQVWFDANSDGTQNEPLGERPELGCTCLAQTRIYLRVPVDAPTAAAAPAPTTSGETPADAPSYDADASSLRVHISELEAYAARSEGVTGWQGAPLKTDDDGWVYTNPTCQGQYSFEGLRQGTYAIDVVLGEACTAVFTQPEAPGQCSNSDVIPLPHEKAVTGEMSRADADPTATGSKVALSGMRMVTPRPKGDDPAEKPAGLDDPCVDIGLTMPEPVPTLPRTGSAAAFVVGWALMSGGAGGCLLSVRSGIRANSRPNKR